MKWKRLASFACAAAIGLSVQTSSPAQAALPGLSCIQSDALALGICVTNLNDRQSAGIKNLATTPFAPVAAGTELQLVYYTMDQFPNGTATVLQRAPFSRPLALEETIVTPDVVHWQVGVFCARIASASEPRSYDAHCVDTNGVVRRRY